MRLPVPPLTLVRAAAVIAGVGLAPLNSLHAQVTSFTACTTGALADCALIRLTSTLGVGSGGTNFFEIAIGNLGSLTTPSMATTIYNLVFLTGQAPVTPGSELDVSVVPTGGGGASVSDPTTWDLFDSGDAIFLSAFSNNGVGGCVAGGAVDGFSQGGQTCGSGEFVVFDYFTPQAYDPSAFTLADLEVVGLTPDLPADSCGTGNPCALRADAVSTPEPDTVSLLATALCVLSIQVRRKARFARPLFNREG